LFLFLKKRSQTHVFFLIRQMISALRLPVVPLCAIIAPLCYILMFGKTSSATNKYGLAAVVGVVQLVYFLAGELKHQTTAWCVHIVRGGQDQQGLKGVHLRGCICRLFNCQRSLL
jgi:hypothetical protein